MTITAAQIQQARELLRMQSWQIGKLAGVSTAEIMLAEIEHADPSVSRAHVDAIRLALEAAGVEFRTEGGEGAGATLRKSLPTERTI